MEVWGAGTQAGEWAGIDHQLTLCPARVPGSSPCRGSSAGQGLGLCWRAVLAWLGWCFTQSMSLGTAGLGGDIGISGMVCAHKGIGAVCRITALPSQGTGARGSSMWIPNVQTSYYERSPSPALFFLPAPAFYIALLYMAGKKSGYKLSPDQGFTFPFPIVVKTGKGCCRTSTKRTLISSI